MLTIPDITKDAKLNDLFVVSNYDLHVQYLTDNIIEGRMYEALYMTRFYEPWFAQHSSFARLFPARYKQLQELIIDNKWIAFYMLPQADTVELLNSHLLALFTMPQRRAFPWDYVDLPDFTLGEQMRINLLRIADLEARDYYKVKLAVALKKNQEVLTTAPFFGAVKQVNPTLEAWFQEYLRAIGPHPKSSEFLLAEFLNKSEAGAKLNATERHRLELIFKLYHRLMRSSWTPEGTEEKFTFESEKQVGVVQYGEFIPYDQTTVQTIKELADTTTTQGTTARPPVARVDMKGSGQKLATGPDVTATAGPDHFTEQDAAEINQHAQAKAGLAAPAIDYTALVATLKQELALTFPTPDQDKRFSDLVVSVLRGLRDTMELKQYLVDLALPSADVDAIIAAVEQRISTKPAKPSGVAAKLAKKPTLDQLAVKATLASSALPATPASPAIPPPSKKTFLPKLRRARNLKRPLVDDVRLQPSMVMGPMDELRAMDPLEFRRLSADPMQAAARVRDKISLLGEESVAKQAEGITAFKQSPLNTLYLELGNESISSGLGVTDIIAKREAAGTPTLSVAEFNAIADLNKQVRF